MVHIKTDKQLKVSFDAFRFRNTSGVIYIHCSVMICLSKNDGEGDCEFECESKRRKRSADAHVRYSRSTKVQFSDRYELETGAIVILENGGLLFSYQNCLFSH